MSSPDETSCLYYNPARGSFQTARQRCRQVGGQVVQPKTAITTQLVANLLRNDPSSRIYPGSDMTCFVCSNQLAEDCINSQILQPCSGTGVGDRNLMSL